MKKIGIIFAMNFLFIHSLNAQDSLNVQDYKMALGARFSSDDAAVNHSISFKYFLSEKIAVETLFSFGDPFAIGLLVEKHNPILSNKFKWFYGAGAYVGFGVSRKVGAQGILGMDYKVPSIPLNFSLDWKPELNFYSEFSFEPAAVGLSARFTLK